MIREYRTLNRTAGAAAVVAAYSLYNAAALAFTPQDYIATPSHVLVFEVIPRWVLALAHVVLSLALFGSLRASGRLVVAMVTSALYFTFWAGVTVIPALLGQVAIGNTMGLGAYLFAAGYTLFWARQMTRVDQGGEDAP